ncbi:MAG: histidinol-phosphatase [Vicinamibacteria bacterium]|nr:histidinol-phosphatase [Vicinamibacteria bacterium]
MGHRFLATNLKSSLHVHTTFSDGKADPEEYVRAAIDLGLATIGFSEHGPCPFASGWNIARERLPDYLDEIGRMKALYGDRIEVLVGIEADFLPGVQGPDSFRELGLDYVIGAVHFLRTGGGFLEIDYSPKRLKTVLDEGFGGNVVDMVSAYYAAVREMIETQPPDILAHLDLVKKFNREMRLIDENEDWYRNEAFGTLESLARTSTVLEVSTAPIYRGFCDEPYPSRFILEKARALGIPVVVTSDAHWPDALNAGYAETAALLANVGYDIGH